MDKQHGLLALLKYIPTGQKDPLLGEFSAQGGTLVRDHVKLQNIKVIHTHSLSHEISYIITFKSITVVKTSANVYTIRGTGKKGLITCHQSHHQATGAISILGEYSQNKNETVLCVLLCILFTYRHGTH